MYMSLEISPIYFLGEGGKTFGKPFSDKDIIQLII